jgi:hypothetical protein
VDFWLVGIYSPDQDITLLISMPFGRMLRVYNFEKIELESKAQYLKQCFKGEVNEQKTKLGKQAAAYCHSARPARTGWIHSRRSRSGSCGWA